MLPTTNRIISVKSLTGTGKRTYSTTITGLSVYINQNGEELGEGFDSEGSFFAHRMLTDGTHTAIAIGDRVTSDDGKQYDVRGKAIYDDITGIHHQYLLVEGYE
jgi:hypothetical protein